MRSTVPSSQSLCRSRFRDQNWSYRTGQSSTRYRRSRSIQFHFSPEDQALEGGQMTKCIKQIRIGFPALRKGNIQKLMYVL